jgi:hypothetical protein
MPRAAKLAAQSRKKNDNIISMNDDVASDEDDNTSMLLNIWRESGSKSPDNNPKWAKELDDGTTPQARKRKPSFSSSTRDGRKKMRATSPESRKRRQHFSPDSSGKKRVHEEDRSADEEPMEVNLVQAKGSNPIMRFLKWSGLI